MRTKGNLWGSIFSFHLFVTSRDWIQGLCMLSYLVGCLLYILYFLLLASFLYLLILMAVFSQGPFALICIHLQKGVHSSTRTPELPSSPAPQCSSSHCSAHALGTLWQGPQATGSQGSRRGRWKAQGLSHSQGRCILEKSKTTCLFCVFRRCTQRMPPDSVPRKRERVNRLLSAIKIPGKTRKGAFAAPSASSLKRSEQPLDKTVQCHSFPFGRSLRFYQQ